MTTTIDRADPILVAGAGGFIGGWLVRHLCEEGFTNVRAVDLKPLDDWYQALPGVDNRLADLRSVDTCREAVDGVAHVYNLACDMGGMGFIEANKAACMISVLINTHLLMAGKDADLQRFFFASSACIYNIALQQDADVTALREEDAYPALPEDGYGWEKLFSERMCRHFLDDFGINTRVARYHNVYGPHGTYDGGREKAPAVDYHSSSRPPRQAVEREVRKLRPGCRDHDDVGALEELLGRRTPVDGATQAIHRRVGGDGVEHVDLPRPVRRQ